MTQTYRVRYSMKKSGQHHASDVGTADIESDLENICEHLPPGVYILYIEDLIQGRDVHWTRWPKSYRPGFGGDERLGR